MNTMQLECFLAVADNLSFARAAEQLHVTQPAITHQINSLENELQAKLVRRTTRIVELTDDGRTFLGYARSILKAAHFAKNRLSEHHQDYIQTFAIGCHSPSELNLIAPALKQLYQNFPMLHPDLRMIPFPALRNMLEEEAIDVMIGFRDEKINLASVTYIELAQSQIACALPKEHPLADKKQLTLEDLNEEPVVLCEPDRCAEAIAQFQSQLLASHSHSPSQIYFGENLECTLTFTKAGIGVSLLPNLPFMHQEGLTYVPLENESTISFGLYYKTSFNSPILKTFIQILKELCQTF